MLKQAGLSIVELMIAMTLSLLLGLGIFQVFTSNQQSARMTQALVHIQDSGRLALDMMARDIRNADYWGCAGGLDRVSSTIDTGNPQYDEGAHGFGQANLPGLNAGDNVAAGVEFGGLEVRPGTDFLELRGLSSMGLSIAQAMPLTSAALFVTDNEGFQQDDILAVSDCQSADVFQVTNFNAAGGGSSGFNVVHNAGNSIPGNTTQNLSRRYPVGAQILLPVYRVYFINVQNGVSRLMMRDESGTTSVLIDHVEDMQLVFGVDINGSGTIDQFMTGTEIVNDASVDYDDVLSVDVTLRLASPQTNVIETGIEYAWNDNQPLDAAEDLGRLRRQLSTVASVRSRTQ